MTEKINDDPINRTQDNPFGIQKNYQEYYKPQYLSPSRMSSYSYQYSLALETECKSFLNIGSANNILSYLLSKQKKLFINLDLDYDTHPDLVATFPKTPFADKSFDAVLCFQVLEHFPFSNFSFCLSELKRLAIKFIILSLPDISLSKRAKVKYFLYDKLKHPREWKLYKMREKSDEHFWEIGYGNINFLLLKKMFEEENVLVKKHFRNKLNRYHHFFVLEIK